MFSKIGFFRFASHYAAPLPALASAIQRYGDISGSLIVLPEGFNIGKYYKAPGLCNRDRQILQDLQLLAREKNAVFIAGLIIEEPEGFPNAPELPFNSAWLIDGDNEPQLLCRKAKNDGTFNYTGVGVIAFKNNVVEYKGTSIAAMICLDCDEPLIENPLKKALADVHGQQLVCIPACMDGKPYGNETRAALATFWEDHFVIFSNSDVGEPRSFVSRNGVILEPDSDDWNEQNSIVLFETGNGNHAS